MKIEHSTPASTPELGSEEKKSLAVRALMMMADGDRSVFGEVLSADAVNREAKSEPPPTRVHGPDGFFATALWLRDAFADLKFEVKNVVEQDDLVVLDTVMSARHEGPFATYDEQGRVDQVFVPTGKSFTVRQAHWMDAGGRRQDRRALGRARRPRNGKAGGMGATEPDLADAERSRSTEAAQADQSGSKLMF